MSADPTAPPPAEEPPKTLFDKLGAALPIALTAIATAFAGLSSSEMSRAMYWRSAAAQDQAKANDQWSFAGFKRDRSLICQAAADQLRMVGDPGLAGMQDIGPDKLVVLNRLLQRLESTSAGGLPAVEDPALRDALAAVRDRRPEAETVPLAWKVDPDRLNAAVAAAEAAVRDYERGWDPILKSADEEVGLLDSLPLGTSDEARRGPPPVARFLASRARAARYDLDHRRYRAESTLNQGVGYLYEVRVKRSIAESDRHRVRSENFFYAMLAGQIGAVIASLQLARKHGSALWGLAGLAGLIAVVFGVYVYLGM